MKILRQNSIMGACFPMLGEDVKGELPHALNLLVAGGLVFRDRCVFLSSLLGQCSSIDGKELLDETGYECFVNKIHIEDYAQEDLVSIGMRFLREISSLCFAANVSFPVHGVISAADDCVIVRFHRVRPGQNWLDADLENYKAEGIAEVEVYHPVEAESRGD